MIPLNELEAITLSELEAIGRDERLEIPSGLDDELRGLTALLAFADESDDASRKTSRSKTRLRPSLMPDAGLALRDKAWRKWLPAAASVAVLLVSGALLIGTPKRPADTFSDPAEAYAMLEETFSLMGSKVQRGVELASGAETVVENVKSKVLGYCPQPIER